MPEWHEKFPLPWQQLQFYEETRSSSVHSFLLPPILPYRKFNLVSHTLWQHQKWVFGNMPSMGTTQLLQAASCFHQVWESRGCLFYFCEKCHWNFVRNCIELVDCFGQYGHFNNILPIHEHGIFFHLFVKDYVAVDICKKEQFGFRQTQYLVSPFHHLTK